MTAKRSRTQYSKQYRAGKKAEDPNWGAKLYEQRKLRLNSDPALFVANKISKQKDAARRRGIPWTLDTDKITQRLLAATHCSISGRKLVFQIGHANHPSIDRKNSKLGYTPRNIQIVSYAANVAKMDASDKDFIQLCIDVVLHHKKSGKTKRQ